MKKMGAKDLIIQDASFPTLTGDIVEDTDTIIGELAVGNFVVERGMARLYMVWRSKLFLQLTSPESKCNSCGFVFDGADDTCPKCGGGTLSVSDIPVYPTLEAYLSYVADMTGKSRQTLFSRLKVYRVLCDDREVIPESAFKLLLLSSGAASKLASADEGSDNLALENNSWQDTVNKALDTGSKSGALEYIKYDVLRETKITSSFDVAARTGIVYREYTEDGGDQYVLEEYKFVLDGNWPDQVIDWFTKRLGSKVE